jgi:integrase/recombinase XerD
MAEWLKAHAWKACIPQGIQGSNPCLSAIHLAETRKHKSAKTLAAYRVALDDFEISCAKEKRGGINVEEIGRADMLDYIFYMRSERGLSPRTIRNRVDHVQIFIRHHGLPAILKGGKLPAYTQKQVRAYSEADLARMFAIADTEEFDRLSFLLCTGTREQEAQYACWSDVDLDAKTYTVTEHLDIGFRPKDGEEGTIPIPTFLVERLAARRKRYPENRLIFATKANKPDGHLLRIVKDLGMRAGLNCGHCTNKAGKSCADFPVCGQILLHKFRKTFATTLSKNGTPPRTIMRYLRHSELDTTLRYLADYEDDDHTRAIVETAFQPRGAQS